MHFLVLPMAGQNIGFATHHLQMAVQKIGCLAALAGASLADLGWAWPDWPGLEGVGLGMGPRSWMSRAGDYGLDIHGFY